MSTEFAVLPKLELKAQNENKITLFEERLERLKNGRHNGITDKFINDNLNEEETQKIVQYRTFDLHNKEGKFIYEEIIKYNNYPLLSLSLWNNKNKEILLLLIYISENEQVIQQIRSLTYEHFFNEYNNDEDIIKSKEYKNIVIINSSLLDFFVDYSSNQIKKDLAIAKYQEEMKKTAEKQEVKQSWWKRVVKITVDLAEFSLAWTAIPFFGNLIAPVLAGGIVVTTTVIAFALPFVIAGLIVGSLVWAINKLKKQLFPFIWKSKDEINLEKKFQEQKETLKKEKDILNQENQDLKENLKKHWELRLNESSAKQKMNILSNKFHEFIEKNKDMSFDNLWKWLSNKIDKQNEIWTQAQVKKIENTNEKWNEFKNSMQNINSWKLINDLHKNIEYDEYGKIKATTQLKNYSQKLYNDFEKNLENNKWDFKLNVKQECENSHIVNNSPFKFSHIENKIECLNSFQPSTSRYKSNSI